MHFCTFLLWHFPLYIITKKNRWCDVHFPTACYQILPHHRLHIMSLLELKPSKCFSFDIIGHSTEIQIFQHVLNTLYYKWQYVVSFLLHSVSIWFKIACIPIRIFILWMVCSYSHSSPACNIVRNIFLRFMANKIDILDVQGSKHLSPRHIH